MMGANPNPSTAVYASQARSSGRQPRSETEGDGDRQRDAAAEREASGAAHTTTSYQQDNHSQEQHSHSRSACHTPSPAVPPPTTGSPAATPAATGGSPSSACKGVDDLQDEEFKRVLSPATGLDGLMLSWSWSDERQDEFVAALQPHHLSLLMSKRIQASLIRKAETLTFSHLSVAQRDIPVLIDASGELNSGEMVGLIGGPDSGVSPLLTALSQQLPEKQITGGQILYDGRLPGHNYHQQVGFAVKQDSHIAALTVYESLYFSARLRILDVVPDSAIRLNVKIVLKLLGLSHCSDTIIGNAMTRGISGGEKRRVGFGLEMVAGHSCILADLPTNGLDSATAFGLLQTIKYACSTGICVMLSLVQASPELLTLFDRLILLCKGRIIYTGTLDRVEQYLNDIGFVRSKTKALPQFLEELSSKPDQFYRASPNHKQPSTTSPAAASPRENQQAQNQDGNKKKEGDQVNIQIEEDDGGRGQQKDDVESGGREHRDHASHADTPAKQQQSPTTTSASQPPTQQPQSPKGKQQQQEQQPQPQSPQPQIASCGNEDEEDDDASNPMKVALNQLLHSYEQTQDFKDLMNRVDHPQQHKPRPQQQQPQQQQQHSQQPLPLDGVASHKDKQPRQQPASSNSSSSGPSAARHDRAVLNLSHSGFWRPWYERYSSGPWLQFKQNLHRQAILTYRNTGLWRDIWILAIIIGLVVGSLFYDLGDDEVGVRNRLGLYFYVISYLGFNAVQLAPVLASQRVVFSHQTKGGYYHSSAYFFSLLLAQLPIVVVETLLVLTPIWGLSHLTGMDWGGGFWFAYFVVCLTSYTSRAYVFIVYGASPNEAYTDVLNQVSNIIFTKLCGYFIPQGQIDVGWHWVYYLSYFTYSFRALALNDILPITNNCTPSPTVDCTFTTGAQALEQLYTMDPSWDKWLQLEYLVDFFIIFSIVGYLCVGLIDWVVMEDFETPNFEIDEQQEQEKEGQQPQEGGQQQPQGTAKTPKEQQQKSPSNKKRQQAVRNSRRKSISKSTKPYPYSDIVVIANSNEEDAAQQIQVEDTNNAINGDIEQALSSASSTSRTPRVKATPHAFHYQHRIHTAL